jgi:hypothetical protein
MKWSLKNINNTKRGAIEIGSKLNHEELGMEAILTKGSYFLYILWNT